MPAINPTALELYIKGFLRTQGIRTIGRQYAQKAAALIDEKLGIPCCDDPGATIDLVTRFDNNFTNAVRMLLANLPKTGNKQSLIRSKKLIDNYLNCCAPQVITFAPENTDSDTGQDATNTFTFPLVDGITDPSAYEVSFDGGNTWTTVTSIPIVIGDVDIPVGQLCVRLKAGVHKGKHYKTGKSTCNQHAFHTGVAPAAPTSPVTDDTANTFDWTYNPSYTTPAKYEYTLNSGTSYTTVSVKPLAGLTGVHAIGTVGVRVKAGQGNPPSATLYNLVAFS